MSLDSLPPGYYAIAPVGAPEGYNISTGPISPPRPELPLTVDKLQEVWKVIQGDNGTFCQLVGPTPYEFKWVNIDNVLCATAVGPADNFRIEAAGLDVWVIALPNKNLYLTSNGVEPRNTLTFEPPIDKGSSTASTQQFRFEHPLEERD